MGMGLGLGNQVVISMRGGNNWARGIAAVRILFMIANISVPHAMQFAVTGRV